MRSRRCDALITHPPIHPSRSSQPFIHSLESAPHDYNYEQDAPISRFMIFAPIFGSVLLLLLCGFGLYSAYATQIHDAHARADE